MTFEKIETTAAPAAIGPYSQGVRIGEIVFFSGQIPLDPATGELVGEDINIQTKQVMANMGAALEAAGLSYEHVAKTTIYLVDLGDFAVVNEIYGKFFGEVPPARATVEVAALPKGAKVEIEWIACGC
ncbi:MAG: reactive intermediate/imine deaminase [Desulfuromonas sp.]|nr:MAG: reactive intermediate/imine deaminase [Desulfuromonas sp.]